MIKKIKSEFLNDVRAIQSLVPVAVRKLPNGSFENLFNNGFRLIVPKEPMHSIENFEQMNLEPIVLGPIIDDKNFELLCHTLRTEYKDRLREFGILVLEQYNKANQE